MNTALKLKARVHNGRLLLDVPTDLPEGTVIDLVEDDPYAYLDHHDELDDEQRRELHATLKQSMEQIEAGQGIPAEDVIRELKEL